MARVQLRECTCVASDHASEKLSRTILESAEGEHLVSNVLHCALHTVPSTSNMVRTACYPERTGP